LFLDLDENIESKFLTKENLLKQLDSMTDGITDKIKEK
jgi:hypothetical protein